MRRADKAGFGKGAALLSLLAHLLLLRLLVGEAGSVPPPERSHRELPLLVGLAEQKAELPQPPGMPEALSVQSSGESEPDAVVGAVEEPGFSGEEGVFAGPTDEAELGPFGEPSDFGVLEPSDLFLPDAPPLKLADRRWEGAVRLGIYVDK
ncbi:MAG TPA: hypothetical protein ENN88_04735, partial [Candidatus Coatesbacteria bacterium]|nr:hypothetical protein [Candidatus Coatesbacteria bacterium]